MGLSDEDKRKLAKGPFGTLTSQHALQFGKAAFFGLPPGFSKSPEINNGTVTLVDLGNGPIGITCSHVIEGYRERREKDSRIIFQIGHFQFDPLKHLIADSPSLDLATIDLGGGRLDQILTKEAPGNQCYRPAKAWPPEMVVAGDVVSSLGGFPGPMRERLSGSELLFNAYCHSGSRVDSVSDKHFACHFEREYWVTASSPEDSLDFKDFEGMSGGPVFIDRGLYFEFVGVISEIGKEFDLLRVSLVRSIRRDGTIDDA